MAKLIITTLLTASLFSVTAFSQTPDKGPLMSVPDINGLAVTLVKPAFPETSIVTGADGSTVSLRVVVDENGYPVSAVCSLSCPAMLKDAAELAAMTSKFKPQTRDGKPVKYSGILLYTYVVKHINWHRFGTAIESVRQFDNISAGPVAQMLSDDFAAEKAKLLELDAEGVELETRWATIADVIAAILPKLGAVERWRFGTALALRRVTIWTQAREAVNRDEMQRALTELASAANIAPPEISKEFVEDLRTVSEFRIDPQMPERELRKAIFEMTSKIRNDSK